ncbi:MAG: YciI family protein [Ignavibacteriales bacterium]|nr:YciI family protein [Ignavibacteriales bacterium]
MIKYNEELAKAGALIALDGLRPIEKGARVTFSRGKATVTDGPFAETKEQLGGTMMLEARDLNHAIQLMSNHPSTRMRGEHGRFVRRMSRSMLCIRKNKKENQPWVRS